MFSNYHHRSAFTLVELLVAMVIAGIISSMVAIALGGAQRQAQNTRTQGMVNAMNVTMLQLYEEQTTTRVSLPRNARSANTRALSELMWRRDWLRCTFPDRREDIAENPVRVRYPMTDDPLSGNARWDYLDDANRNPAFGTPFAAVPVPVIGSGLPALGKRSAQLLRMRQRIASAIGRSQNVVVTSFAQLVNGNAADGEWTAQHQSAECLYLILSTNMVNGVPASDQLRTRDVGDTDGDGMPEVLDAWGVPFGFMRWPSGFALVPEWNVVNLDPVSSNTRTDWQWVHNRKAELGADFIDILQVDPRYSDNRDTSLANPRADDPFPLIPMIVSAGQDGAFDLFGLDDAGLGLPVINYAVHGNGWPNESGSLDLTDLSVRPQEPLRYPNNITFVDPFMDAASVNAKLGARIDANDDRDDNSADNVYPALLF